MNAPMVLAKGLNGTLVIVFTTFVIGSIVRPGAAQSCDGLPAPPTTTQEVLVSSDAWDSAVAIEQCGRNMVVTHQFGELGLDETVRVMIQRFLPDATLDGATQLLSAPHEGLPPCGPIHEAASIAVSPLGRVRVAWRGLERDCQEGIG